jgi:hypothetical protein
MIHCCCTSSEFFGACWGLSSPSSAVCDPAEVREFILHVLCMDSCDLRGSQRDDIVRLYQEWNCGGDVLRTASHRELKNAAGMYDYVLDR